MIFIHGDTPCKSSCYFLHHTAEEAESQPCVALLASCSDPVVEQVAQAKYELSIWVIIPDSLVFSGPSRCNSGSVEHLVKCHVPCFIWRA